MKDEDIQAITCLKATRAAQLFSWLEALHDPSTWAFRGQPRCWGNLSPSFSREFPADAPRRIVADIERKITQEFRTRYATRCRRDRPLWRTRHSLRSAPTAMSPGQPRRR